MVSINIPTISWGKRKTRSGMTRIYTDDGRVIKTEVEVPPGGACLLDIQHSQGFLISPPNQFEHDNNSWQILYEKSCQPLALREAIDTKMTTKLVNQMARDNYAEIKRGLYKDARKNSFSDRLVWIVIIVMIGVITFGAMAYIHKSPATPGVVITPGTAQPK